MLTDGDAFDTFPPFPFDLLFRLGRHPVAARPWVTPYLTDAGVRRDVTTFLRGWRPTS